MDRGININESDFQIKVWKLFLDWHKRLFGCARKKKTNAFMVWVDYIFAVMHSCMYDLEWNKLGPT